METVIPKYFSRTYAASLILKNVEQINSCPGAYESLSYISHLSLVTANHFNNKEFILSSFAECCYYIFDWFQDCESLLSAINVSQGKDYTLMVAKMFFNASIEDVLKIQEYNFLNIIDTKEFSPIPDIKDNLILDFYSNIICLKEKNRVIVNDDIRELLVYYSFLWIEEGYKNANRGVLPNQILEDYFVKLKAAISDNKYYKWEYIDPTREIKMNLLNPYLSILRKLYFKYLA